MTQIIVTLDDNTRLPLIKKAISLLRGVTHVSVRRTKETEHNEKVTIPDVSPDVLSLIGLASDIPQQTIADDERLNYLLSK